MSSFELKKATYYYYGLLSEHEKELYRTMMSAMLQHIETINTDGSFSKAQIGRVISYVDKDRPDIFWVDPGYTMTTQNNVIIKVTFRYTFSQSEKNNMIRNIENSRFYREINSILSKKKSSFEKALAAYEYIITHTEYEERALRDNSSYYSYAYSMYGAILKSRAVCSGYSKTFQYFMSKHDIICTLATGNTKRGRHAWNLINLYGSYYYIDATWGDPTFSGNSTKQSDYVSYDYFCITTEDLRKSHNPVLDEKMPLCTDTKYNYYRFFGLIEDNYSIENVANHILNSKKSGKSEAVIKYSNQLAYRTAASRLFNGSEVFDALKLASRYNRTIKTENVRYNVDDIKYQITIKL